MPRNGTVKKILVTAAAAVLAAATIGTGSAFVAYGNRITVLETRNEDIIERLKVMDQKLDRLLYRRSPE